jgi:hypothetical protein
VLSLIIAVSGVAIAGLAFRETQYEQRPWLGAPAIASIDVSNHPGVVGFEYVMNNVGKLPPRGMYIGAGLVTVDQAHGWESLAEGKCKDGIAASKSPNRIFYKFSIIPGSQFRISDKTGNPAITTTLDRARDPSNLHIAGCIVYATNDIFHHLGMTKFAAPLDINDRADVFDRRAVVVRQVDAISPN